MKHVLSQSNGTTRADAEPVHDTTERTWSFTVASYRILVSRLKALSGKILWERFRCKLEDSVYIILESS